MSEGSQPASGNVLLASPYEEDHTWLRYLFADSRWTLQAARTCQETRAALCVLSIGVVLSEGRLSDGCWKDVLHEIQALARPPALIVTDRLADECLWAEVLNRGGYDLLRKPFEPEEVLRVVSNAWCCHHGNGWAMRNRAG